MSEHFSIEHENELCSEKISKMKQILVDAMYEDLEHNDISGIDAEEAGEVIDMIKDLAAAERYCAQACYYASVTEAMHSGAGHDIGDMMSDGSFSDTVASLKRAWGSADMALKKEMKNDLTKLINEMV